MHSGHQGSWAPVCEGGAWMVGWGAVDGEDKVTQWGAGALESHAWLQMLTSPLTVCVCVA